MQEPFPFLFPVLPHCPARLLMQAKSLPVPRVALVNAGSINALAGIREAAEAGLAMPILIGNRARINAVADEIGWDIGGLRMIHVPEAEAAVEAAAAAAREMNVRKAVMLPVSAPFHCDMMAPAAEAMADALKDAVINAPRVPIVNNVTARPTSDPDQIRADLVTQVTGRVRWRESVEWMAGEGGITTLAEPGCGKVLTVMLRRIVKGLDGTALNSPESLEAFANQLKGNE